MYGSGTGPHKHGSLLACPQQATEGEAEGCGACLERDAAGGRFGHIAPANHLLRILNLHSQRAPAHVLLTLQHRALDRAIVGDYAFHQGPQLTLHLGLCTVRHTSGRQATRAQ